jgi:hypothetical protein
MRYEEFYNEQVIKYKKRRAFLTKKLPFILIGLVILLSAIVVLFFTSGTPYEYGISDLKIGDTIQNTPKSFLASARYEFLVDGKYQEEQPTKPGSYSYRIASTNIFGVTKYSSDYEFVIEKGKATISIEDTTVDYGFEPKKIISNVPYDKKISSYTIEFEDKHQLNTKAWVSDVTIIDSLGVDITDYYDLEFPKTEITLVKVPLVITLKDKEKVYDGTPLEYEGEEDYTIRGLINGDEEVHLEVEGSQTLVGDSEYKVTNVSIKDKDGNAYETYDYVFESGLLTVTEKTIEFETKDCATTYNGEVQEVDEYQLSEDIPDSVTVDPIEVNLVGKYSYELTPKFINSDGVDVSYCYIVEYTYGFIAVNKAKAKVTLDDMEVEYSGNTIFDDTYTLDSGNLFDSELKIKVDSSIREVGVGKITYKSYTLTKDGIDVSDSFDLEIESGNIEIVKKDLTIKPKSTIKEYDGLTFETNKYEQEGLVSSDTLAFTSTCSATEIGISEIVIDSSTISIMHNGEDVSYCYNITEDFGLLTITKRKLKLKVFGTDITYGDTPVFSYACGKNDGLLENDTVYIGSYNYTMNIGINEIDIQDFSISDGSNLHNDLYDVTIVKGTFTIFKKSLKVSLSSKSKIYDGNELEVNDSDYYISSGELLSTDSITFIPSNITALDVGTRIVPVTVDNVFIKNENDEEVTSYYNIELSSGSLTITPRVVNITTGSITKSYDFGVLTCDEASVSGLVSGQVIEIEITGELFYVGSASNTIGKIRVYSSSFENAVDLTENYTFNIHEGTLTYTERSA